MEQKEETIRQLKNGFIKGNVAPVPELTPSNKIPALNEPKKLSKFERPRLATYDVSANRPSLVRKIANLGAATKKHRMTLSVDRLTKLDEMHEELKPSLANIQVSNFSHQDEGPLDTEGREIDYIRRRTTRKSIFPRAVVSNVSDHVPQPLDVNTHIHVKNKKLTRMLAITVLTITLSSFQYGWAIGVVNAPQKIVTGWYNTTYYHRHNIYMKKSQVTGYWALTVAIANMSGLFGGLSSGFFCDFLGRKRTLITNNILTFLAAILILTCKLASSYEMLILARLFIGFNNGIASGAVSIYLAEVAPINLRGSMCSAHQVMLSLAIFISQVLGLPQIMGTESLWPLLFALSIFPAIAQVCILPFLPESPRYLLIFKEQEKEAKNALIRLRNTTDVEDEIEQMKVEYQDQKRLPPVTWGDMVRKQVYRQPLIIASETSVSQQLTAISAVLSYSTALFISAGIAARNATYVTLVMGFMYFVLCALSLVIIERAGRRTLFLTGLGGMWFSTILITVCLGIGNRPHLYWVSYLGVFFIFTYVGFCAIGPSVIAWFIPAELFTQAARPKGMSIAVGFNWLSSFLAVFLFPIMLTSLEDYIFLVFTVLLALFWMFTYMYLPETQGRTSDELARLFMTPKEISRIHKFWRNYHFQRHRNHPHHHNHNHDTRM